jgi:MOSC domain-containing protein YiiM
VGKKNVVLRLPVRVARGAVMVEGRTDLRDSAREKLFAATVKAICRSERRSDSKRNVGQGELRAGWGLAGDSHAGPARPGRWQISLLAWESVERLIQEHDLSAVAGSFAENLTTVGLDTSRLQVRDRLKIGDQVVLEVEQLGKPPEIAHTFSFQGHSLLPTEGIFCGVVVGGIVRVGDKIMVSPR